MLNRGYDYEQKIKYMCIKYLLILPGFGFKFGNIELSLSSLDTLSRFASVCPLSLSGGSTEVPSSSFDVDDSGLSPASASKDFLPLGLSWSEVGSSSSADLIIPSSGDNLAASSAKII